MWIIILLPLLPARGVYAATQTQFSLGSGLGLDTTIELYSTDGTTLLEADTDDGNFGPTSSSIAGTVLSTTGTYFIKVINPSFSTSEICPYDLYLALQSGSPTAEMEPNNNGGPPNAPTALPSGGGWGSGA